MTSQPSAAVFGLGHPDRADDAAGLAVAERVAGLGLPVTVVPMVSPLELIDAWAGYDLVVVVDAIRSGSPAGSVSVLRMTDVPPGGARHALDTHALGLADTLELARALDRLPGTLVVVGIELADAQLGADMSAAVSGAIDAGVEAVLSVLAERSIAGSR